MKFIFIFCIKGYIKLVSPILPATCRFYPTCSCYAIEAIQQHGAFKGGYYAMRRLLKCHPYYKCDFMDSVPQQKCRHNNKAVSSKINHAQKDS